MGLAWELYLSFVSLSGVGLFLKFYGEYQYITDYFDLCQVILKNTISCVKERYYCLLEALGDGIMILQKQKPSSTPCILC